MSWILSFLEYAGDLIHGFLNIDLIHRGLDGMLDEMDGKEIFIGCRMMGDGLVCKGGLQALLQFVTEIIIGSFKWVRNHLKLKKAGDFLHRIDFFKKKLQSDRPNDSAYISF